MPPLPQYTGLAHQQQQQQQQQTSDPAPGAYPYHSAQPLSSATFPPARPFGGFRRFGGRGGRGGHLNTWEAAKAYNSMSQYNSNPVGALQERFQSRGIMPNYRMVQAEGASHCPTFSYQVFVLDFIALGESRALVHVA